MVNEAVSGISYKVSGNKCLPVIGCAVMGFHRGKWISLPAGTEQDRRMVAASVHMTKIIADGTKVKADS